MHDLKFYTESGEMVETYHSNKLLKLKIILGTGKYLQYCCANYVNEYCFMPTLNAS